MSLPSFPPGRRGRPAAGVVRGESSPRSSPPVVSHSILPESADMHVRIGFVFLFTACCAISAPAQAQSTSAASYPAKPVRLMLGPGPGSVADGLTRVMAAAFTELWKQQVIVENRSGAGNTIAPAV